MMTDPVREAELARAASGGDRRATEVLLGLLYDQVHAICRRVCHDASDGDDATQNAMISIVRSLPRFDNRSAVRTWAYRIATNAAIDEIRRRNRRPVSSAIDDETLGGTPIHEHAAPIDRMLDRLDIDAALASLPTDFRAAVVLRDLIGMEYADIADTLGLPIGTVRSRIARGRRQLADHLELGNQHDVSDVQRKQP
jgi:RNA polymerase sigma-70 factor (ECF subfamily)